MYIHTHKRAHSSRLFFVVSALCTLKHGQTVEKWSYIAPPGPSMSAQWTRIYIYTYRIRICTYTVYM